MFVFFIYIIRSVIPKLNSEILTTDRQISRIESAIKSLLEIEKIEFDIITKIEFLKAAIIELNKIVGKSFNIEAIYDQIFSNFCIGK